MNERELLGLAARAAGVECDDHGPYVMTPIIQSEFGVGTWIEEVRVAWNPLKDRALNLELAANLGISLTPYPIYNSEARHSVIAKQRRSGDVARQENPTEVIELYRDHPSIVEAWCYAVVRCAAAVGESMP